MPRGGKNHAQGEGKSLRGGNFRALFARAGQYISSPLANFSCTPLNGCMESFPASEGCYIPFRKTSLNSPEVKTEPSRKTEERKSGRILENRRIFVNQFEWAVFFPLNSTILKIYYTILLKYFCDWPKNRLGMWKIFKAASSALHFFRFPVAPIFQNSTIPPFCRFSALHVTLSLISKRKWYPQTPPMLYSEKNPVFFNSLISIQMELCLTC